MIGELRFSFGEKIFGFEAALHCGISNTSSTPEFLLAMRTFYRDLGMKGL
jgi:hypothetical protein